MTFRNTFGLPVLGMLLLCSDAFAGNFADVYGAHPYATGMGNAVSSFINDSSATYSSFWTRPLKIIEGLPKTIKTCIVN